MSQSLHSLYQNAIATDLQFEVRFCFVLILIFNFFNTLAFPPLK